MLKRLFIFALTFLMTPAVWAMTSTLSAPSVMSYPKTINANTYTFTIYTLPGAKVTVVGGSANIAPVADGENNDTVDGKVQIMVGLAQDTENVFSILAEKDGQVSPTTVVSIVESGSAPAAAEPAPEASKPEPVSTEAPLATSFTDTTNHWSKDYVEKLQKAGIVSGKTTTYFDPEGLITRAELTKLAVAAFGLSVMPVTQNPFSDVVASLWYAPYIQAAKNAGIIGGFPDGTFRPNDPVDRAAALKILVLASGYDYAGLQTDFSDVPNEAWFYPFVAFAKNKGVVSGYEDATFKPERPITRAEAAKIVSVLMELES